MLGEYDGSGKLIANYTYGNDLASRVDGSGAADYYDFDANGNTAGLSGQTGGYVDSYSYLPFGEETGSTGSVPNPFQYVGQDGVMTAGNGLDLMRARFYSPRRAGSSSATRPAWPAARICMPIRPTTP